MKGQTRAIKAILTTCYPSVEFKFVYRIANNYAYSSDRVIVKYSADSGVEIDELKNTLYQYTKGISVFKHGEIGIISGNYDSSIYNPHIGVWLDAELLEFIELYPIDGTRIKNRRKKKAGYGKRKYIKRKET